MQEHLHDAAWDYEVGSPHLTHSSLLRKLTRLLRDTLKLAADAGLPLTALEIGAGHGGYTEPMLASGWKVTATEMSRPSLATLHRRYERNTAFEGVFDQDGTLGVLGESQFSLVVCSAVLHHIPDYISFLTTSVLDHMRPGGVFYSFQDPLWYPSINRFVHSLDRAGYYAWRLPRGKYLQGMGAVWRRTRGQLDESSPSDMVEYHVVRSGVDQEQIAEVMKGEFRATEVIRYWSNQSAAVQSLGEVFSLENTFAFRGIGFRGRGSAAGGPIGDEGG